MNTATELPAGTIVALVTDSTPDSLEYGDYRGWVELCEDGTYFRDVTAGEVEASDVLWDTYSADYGKVGTVHQSPMSISARETGAEIY